MNRSRVLLLLAAICALAFWLRTQAIGYGLPAVYNMDEVAIMNRALSFGTGTLNPGNFLYPTFYFYVLFAWQGLTFLVGLALGLWSSLAGFEQQFFLDPSPLYRSGRLLSALCGVLTVVAVWRLGSRLFSPAAGVIAALLMAVTPIAVMDAHYVKHDVPVTLLIVLVHVWLARIVVIDGPAVRRDIWIVGALSGLAMSTHYYAVFVALPVAMVLLTQPGVSWGARLRDGVRAGAVAALVFFAASPFLLPELGTAWVDITQNRQIVMDRATGTGLFPSLWTYLKMLTADRTLVLLAFGTLFLAMHPTRHTIVVLLFPLVFLLFISNTVPATRYLNPILPFVVVGGGVFAAQVVSSFTSRWRWVWSGLFLLALTMPGLMKSVTVGRFFNQADTRTLAQHWIEANVPAGSTVLVQPYSVPLRQSREALVEALRVHLGDETDASVKFQKQLALSPYPTPAYRTIFLGDGGMDVDKIYVSPQAFAGSMSLAPLQALGVQWIIVKRYNVSNPSLAPFDRALARDGRLMQTFSPYDPAADEAARTTVAPFEHNEDARIDGALLRPGPVVEIWRIQ
jgi:4-amino-4-deoxy-L-arabinose transferase-like glycosyltransferase